MHTTTPLCPRCGYDLSGIVASWRDVCPTQGTCSECGVGFAWGDIFYPLLYAPRWSFEHSPRAASSLFASWWRALRPWSFWSRLHMEHPVVPQRLWAMLGVMLLTLHVATSAGMLWLANTADTITTQTGSNWMVVRSTLSILFDPYSRVVGNQYPEVYSAWVYVAAITMLLCPGAFVMLRQTYSRLGIRRDHVLRAAAYALAPLPTVLLFLSCSRAIAEYGSAWALGVTIRTSPALPASPFGKTLLSLDRAAEVIGSLQWVTMPIALAWCGVYWWCFAHRYLRLTDAGRATILLVVVSFLAALAVVTFWPGSTLARDLGTTLMGYKL